MMLVHNFEYHGRRRTGFIGSPMALACMRNKMYVSCIIAVLHAWELNSGETKYKVLVFGISNNDVLPAWELIFDDFLFFRNETTKGRKQREVIHDNLDAHLPFRKNLSTPESGQTASILANSNSVIGHRGHAQAWNVTELAEAMPMHCTSCTCCCVEKITSIFCFFYAIHS